MKLTDKFIKNVLEQDGYIRRKEWREKTACYKLDYCQTMIFGYMHNDIFVEPLSDEDKFSMSYEDILADDWEVVEE